MTAFDLDHRLQQLESAARRIGSNLLELDGDSTVAMLDVAELRGATATTWAHARDTIARLFAALDVLKVHLRGAQDLRNRSRTLSNDRMRELEELLDGPSIVWSNTDLGLADRNLLSESRVVLRRTVDDVISEMSIKFDDAKRVVLTVAAVWDHVVPMLRFERERALELAALAAPLHLSVPHLADPAGELRELAEMALADPLSIDQARLDTISCALDQLALELAEVRRSCDDWPNRIASAHALLTEARATVRECEAATRLAASKVVVRERLESSSLDDHFAKVLSAIVRAGDGGHQRSAAAQLVSWQQQLVDRTAAARYVVARCESLLSERDELRGRLEAFAAKAGVLGLLEEAAISAQYRDARAALYNSPADLDLARDLVTTYQRSLSELGDHDRIPCRGREL